MCFLPRCCGFLFICFLRNPEFAGFRSEPQLFWECGFRGRDCNVSETPGTLGLLLFANSEQLGVHRRELRGLTLRALTLKFVIISHRSVCAGCWGKVPLIVPGPCVGCEYEVSSPSGCCALCPLHNSPFRRYSEITGRTINKWH